MNIIAAKFYRDVDSNIVGKETKVDIRATNTTTYILSISDGVGYQLRIKSPIYSKDAIVNISLIKLDEYLSLCIENDFNLDNTGEYKKAFSFYEEIHNKYISVARIRDKKFHKLK